MLFGISKRKSKYYKTKNPADIESTGFSFCEKATKRCISGGKNDQKYCSSAVRQIGIGQFLL
jgi:hypothetical protein